jgi:hypothetical protein
VQIPVGQQPLRERRKGDAANPFLLKHVEQFGLDPTLVHRVFWLVNEAGDAEIAQDAARLARLIGGVVRDAGV